MGRQLWRLAFLTVSKHLNMEFHEHPGIKGKHKNKKPSMNLKIFATVHSLMNYINLIGSCHAHLPMQFASNIGFIRQKWHWCCDWQRATPALHMQNKPVVCCIGCPCSHWLFRFSVLHLIKPIIQLHIKY